MRGAEFGRIAPENSRHAAEAECLDVIAQQRARLHPFIDKQRVGRAARYCLDAERAGAGEQVQYPGPGDRVAVRMRENVEQGFAQTVGGRSNRVGLRTGKRARTKLAANDPHYFGLGRDGRGPLERSRRCGFLLPRPGSCLDAPSSDGRFRRASKDDRLLCPPAAFLVARASPASALTSGVSKSTPASATI